MDAYGSEWGGQWAMDITIVRYGNEFRTADEWMSEFD